MNLKDIKACPKCGFKWLDIIESIYLNPGFLRFCNNCGYIRKIRSDYGQRKTQWKNSEVR